MKENDVPYWFYFKAFFSLEAIKITHYYLINIFMFQAKNQRLYYTASSPYIGNQSHADVAQMLEKNR